MRQRWEYEVIVDDPELLKRFGLEGWEAWAVADNGLMKSIYLKRALLPTEAEYALMAEQGMCR